MKPDAAILHFYGMTTGWSAMSEQEFACANSRPSHSWNECLRALARRRGFVPRIVMYTARPEPFEIDADGLCWRFVPASLGGLHRAGGGLGRLARRGEYQFSLPFLEELKAQPPDLFVFYGNVPTPFARIVASYLLRQGIPYAVIVHTRFAHLVERPAGGALPGRFAGEIIRAARAPELPFLLRHAGALILLTEADRELAVAERLVDPDRAHVIASGVHPTYYSPAREEEKGPYPTLGFVGRLEDAKGFMDAVCCLARVRARFSAARLLVAGTWTSDAYRREVTEYLDAQGLAPAVTFVGWVGPEDLGPLYRSMHLLLFPSRREGLPRAICEAMTCGVPVAAVAGTGGHDEVIVHGVNGILTDRASFGDEVLALLGDRARMRDMVDAARASMKDYSLESMIDRVERLYVSLMKV